MVNFFCEISYQKNLTKTIKDLKQLVNFHFDSFK
ncbi:Hypothetical Protein SLY_0196 [Strawberry lethal yellows phytoplasma (CPA) str. NZSb11]|uniref:Uncharacterized protein n=1 Tax=Strawberry lethal yellows phytoplasma (CPA) str. NZSb11 TaxID=980422 RepID=R4RZZ8_PHYAS|nr:Hypothetical Protein SLY_0196 [Strawberry lethal yellows phytoplasma (CPA) str. NZSb11]